MQTPFKLLWLFVAASIALPVLADESSSDAALNAFNSRTFISKDDEVNFAANVQDLVGQFIIVNKNGAVILLGDQSVSSAANNVVKLNQRNVFHKLYNNKMTIGGALAVLLKLQIAEDSLKEVSITDLVSVTNKDVTASNCTAKKPAMLTGDYTYYCISGVTLSQVATKDYKKTDKLASGSFGVVTADGNYQLQNGTDGLQLAINISKVGPFKNAGIDLDALGKSTATAKSEHDIHSKAIFTSDSVVPEWNKQQDSNGQYAIKIEKASSIEGAMLRVKRTLNQ